MIINCAALVASAASGAGSAIEEHFDNVHSVLRNLADHEVMISSNFRKADAPLKNTLVEHTEILSLMRTNSRGKVINEIVRDGEAGQKYRDVSSQGWFSETASMNPYYGYIKRRDGDVELFWCFPVGLGGGGNRFGGAMVAKIDLERAMKNISEKIGSPFKLVVDNRDVYEHEWSGAENASVEKLELRGATELPVKLLVKSPPAVASSAKESPVAATDRAETAAKPGAPVEETSPAAPAKRSPVALIIFLAVIGILLITGIALIRMAAKKRHEALLKAIEGDDATFERSETVAVPVAAKHQGMEPPQYRPPTSEENISSEEESLYNPDVMATQIMSPPPGLRASRSAAHSNAPVAAAEIPEASSGGDVWQDAYQKASRELESRFQKDLQAALAKNAEEVGRDAYNQARAGFMRSMQGHGAALSRQVDNLSKIMARTGMPEQARYEAIQHVLAELAQIRDSLEGRRR